jgi:hypothetical protein
MEVDTLSEVNKPRKFVQQKKSLQRRNKDFRIQPACRTFQASFFFSIQCDIYRLITPIKPVPLIETAEKKGFRTWSEKIWDQEFYTYFSLSGHQNKEC